MILKQDGMDLSLDILITLMKDYFLKDSDLMAPSTKACFIEVLSILYKAKRSIKVKKCNLDDIRQLCMEALLWDINSEDLENLNFVQDLDVIIRELAW